MKKLKNNKIIVCKMKKNKRSEISAYGKQHYNLSA